MYVHICLHSSINSLLLHMTESNKNFNDNNKNNHKKGTTKENKKKKKTIVYIHKYSQKPQNS